MSDLDDLNKKYEKGNKVKDIRDSTSKLKETPSNPDTKRAFESRKETLESLIKAAKQATAGFRSQWSGLDDEGKVGIGKGTPGIYYNTVALPAIAGAVDEKYAPDFAVAADKKADKIKEAVRKDMGISEPRGALENFSYVGGEMLGQIPIPASWLGKVKGLGTIGKIAAAPFEFLSPTVDPKAINYGIGTAFGGTLGTALEEPEHKALGGLIQKYENGGRVGRFVSAVDKAIETLKQKKGTGEQILKQLESTPGVKQEELETRGIKQKLQKSPKITQEELLKTAQRNKAPIPERTVLGAGVPKDYVPKVPEVHQKLLDEYGIEPVVNPEDTSMLGFHHVETGEIASGDVLKTLSPEELGIPVGPNGQLTPEAADDYRNLKRAIDLAEKQHQADLAKYATKFQRYSQPGGENYREVLLHLPEADLQAKNVKQNELHELLSMDPSGVSEEEAGRINSRINELINDVTDQGEGFRSSHYDTPNILTHFRVSDRKGPNGEKVLYVDEIQSDWHQRARDARKDYIKGQLTKERSDIHQRALEELKSSGNDLKVSPENERELTKMVNRLTKERKAELEKDVPKDFGYRRPEDIDKITELKTKIDRIRNDGLTPEETKEYFQPGRIVPSYGGQDRVISFNAGEGSPRYKEAYEKALQRAESAGIDREAAAEWATKRAQDETKYDWSVTVIEVDPKTGEPRNGAKPRTHTTSPATEVKDALIKELAPYERKVADAPFKDNWHELATKEILDMAAKEGYDRVAFSPGIEQVNRYSGQLRQALDEIMYQQMSKDDPSLIGITGVKDGEMVFSGKMRDGMFIDGPANGKTAQEVLGGDIANQIETGATQEVGKITGENLTVGGEGMKSFYDKRVPDYVRKYTGKEFGSKPEYLDIQMTDSQPKKPTERDIQRKMNQIADSDDDEFMERAMETTHDMVDRALRDTGHTPGTTEWEDAWWNVMDEFQERGRDQALRDLAIERLNAPEPVKTLRAFTVDVTPKMKERISTESQKLFAATPAIGLGATQTQQPAEEAPKEQAPVIQDEPQGFENGGRVGLTKKAIKKIMGAFTDEVPEVLSKKQADKNLKQFVKESALKKRAFHGAKDPKKLIEDKGFFHYGPTDSEIHWLAEDPELAERYVHPYASSEEGAILPVYAQIKKPLEIPFNMNDDAADEFSKFADGLGLDLSEIKNWATENDLSTPTKVWQFVNTPQFREAAKYRGFDGVKVKEGDFDTWGAFEPTQIKSFFNQGSYDVKDPDIGKRDGGPVGFENGGRVGKVREAAEGLLRVLHGSPTRIGLEKGKNLDVTTDPGYATKRAMDKMGVLGQEGPPMLNKFDIPSSRLLRFEETYSPEDVALMRRFFNRLPQGRSMTGEEIYDAASGKDYVMEGIAKAGGLAGYERPAGGAGGKGNWYRITEQDELTRKARGGLAQLSKTL